MKGVRVQSKIRSFNQLNNSQNNINLQTEKYLNKKKLKSRSTADIPSNLFSSKASGIRMDIQMRNNSKLATTTLKRLKGSTNKFLVPASEKIFMSKSIDREFRQIEFKGAVLRNTGEKKHRERGIQIPFTPQPNWEELRLAQRELGKESIQNIDGDGQFEESSFFDSSTNSITEEDSEEEFSSDSDSSLSESDSSMSEGILEMDQRAKPTKIENKCFSLEKDLDIFENQKVENRQSLMPLEAEERDFLSEKESDEAQGDNGSVLSFLRVTGAKDIKVPQFQAKSRRFSANSIAIKGKRSRSMGNDPIRINDNKTTVLAQKCQICDQRVYNSQDVACFSVCEHHLHEFCLLELIDHKKFQLESLKSEHITDKQPNRFVASGCLFCPKCHQL